MAGWDAFINSMTDVGINWSSVLGRDGVVWAASPGFTLESYVLDVEDENNAIVQVHVNELQRLLYGVENEGNAPDQYGFFFGRRKYFMVNIDLQKRSIYLKSKEGFACIAYTDRAILLGAWVGAAPGYGNERVEFLAGEIVKAGF